MRSDLNMVANTVDVIDYDVKDVKLRVDVLNSEMAETKKVTQHLQEDIDNVRVVSNVALAFGVIGTVGSVASIGMQLASNGISFASKAGYSMLSNCAAEGAETEMHGTSILVGELDLFGRVISRSIQTDITPILKWCNEEYVAIPEIKYDEDDDRNSKTTACSLYTTIDMCNRFRDTLKGPFKLLATRINEISTDLDSIDFSGCVQKSDLARDDINDIVCSLRTK